MSKHFESIADYVAIFSSRNQPLLTPTHQFSQFRNYASQAQSVFMKDIAPGGLFSSTLQAGDVYEGIKKIQPLLIFAFSCFRVFVITIKISEKKYETVRNHNNFNNSIINLDLTDVYVTLAAAAAPAPLPLPTTSFCQEHIITSLPLAAYGPDRIVMKST